MQRFLHPLDTLLGERVVVLQSRRPAISVQRLRLRTQRFQRDAEIVLRLRTHGQQFGRPRQHADGLRVALLLVVHAAQVQMRLRVLRVLGNSRFQFRLRGCKVAVLQRGQPLFTFVCHVRSSR